MMDLFSKYSAEEIIIFIFILGVAIREGIEMYRYFNNLLKKRYKSQESDTLVLKEIKELKGDINVLKEQIDRHNEKLDTLIASDKDDIKAFIVKEHHYYVNTKKCIDDYSMEVLERRFNHYIKEGGNSYAEQLMNEMRALPKRND